MLGILWLIIKIILYILLAIVLIIILAVNVILYVPIRYKVEGVKDGESVDINGKVSWLLSLFRIKFQYNGDVHYKAKVFWKLPI